MRKLVIKAISLAAISTAFLFFTGCKDDDVEEVEKSNVIENLESGILNGTLDQDYALDAGVTYSLTSSFIVPDGFELTIPAGTTIVAEDGGTNVYIAVLQGGMIDIQGTEAQPVVMSSTDGNPGDWGGLTICGYASTTEGVDAVAEVGGFVYGGEDDTDSSGSISYLQIVGTGAQINSESQYNGVSFYAVGSGTTVDNIAVINGDDDGVEFFGGTVNATNLYFENNSDDSIDWTEGWSGSVENVYISHTVSGFSTAFEADGDNGNPTFTDVTVVSSVGGTALQFKKESGATITGLALIGYDVDLDMADNGATSNVIFEDGYTPEAIEDGEFEYSLYTTTTPTVELSDFSWVESELDFETVILSGDVTEDTTLDSSVNYILSSSYIVQEGATLTIPAGTKITADAGGTEVYIAVLKGAMIDIQGTADNPVVIASASATPGDWGGLTICGEGITTEGEDAVAEVGGFIYGGTDNTDNSGSITYLVLKGTGAQINSESQYNGLSLYAVGSETTIENIAIINGDDDGVEFFGGAAIASNLYLENNSDDAVDWTEGWSGSVTNTYISHTVSGFSTAFEADGDNGNPSFTNVTAVSSVGGTALQFKKESGATITGLYIEGYDVDLDMADAGALTNVQVEGADPVTTVVSAEDNEYTLTLTQTESQVDISDWTWKDATL